MSLVVRETAVAATASTTPGGAGVPGAFLAASPAPSAPHAGDASAVSLASDASAVSSAAAAAPHHAAAKHHHPVVPPGDFAARRWIVLFVSCVGVFLASVSTSALIIAFPTVIIALKTELATMMWVLLVVLLCIASVAPLAGKLGDVFGQAGLYKAGFGVFVLGSLGGGLSSVDAKGLDLIGARIAVGVGAGFLFTNSIAIVTDAFAPYNQVGLAQGVFQLCAALGTVLGPLVGGGLATATKDSWRWIFFFNVPSGGLCFLLALWAVRDARPPVKRTWAEHAARLDWLGAASCVLGLILLLLAMIQAVSPTPPLNSPGPLAGLIAGGCVSGAIFIAAEFYATDPLVPPRLFLNWSFTVTTLAGTFMASGAPTLPPLCGALLSLAAPLCSPPPRPPQPRRPL